MRFASHSLTIRRCGISEELNTNGNQRRGTCFRHLIPVVCNVFFKECSPSPRRLFFHMLLEWVCYRLEQFYFRRRSPYCSVDHTQIKLVSVNISFGFSSPFLHWGVQGPSIMSLLLSVLMCFFLLLLIHHSILPFFFLSSFFAQEMSKITIFSIASCSHMRLTWFTGSLVLLRVVLSVFHLWGVQLKTNTKLKLMHDWNPMKYNRI